MNRKIRIAVACVLVLGSYGNTAGAVPVVAPTVSVSLEADDNNRLTEVDGAETEVAGAMVDAKVELGTRGETTSFVVTPRVRAVSYPSESDDSTVDGFVTLAYRASGQRSQLNIDGSYTSVVTLGRFFPSNESDGDIGEPTPGTDIDTGDPDNRREELWLRPQASFDLSEKIALDFGARILDVAYDRDTASRQGYSSLSGDFGIRYRLSATNSVAVVASAGRFEPDNSESTDSYSVYLEMTRNVSDTTELFVRAGASSVDYVDELGSVKERSSFSGGIGGKWELERSRLLLEINRYVDPTEGGELVSRTQARGRLDYRLSERSSLFIGARVIDSSAGSELADFVGSSFAAAELGLRRKLSPSWTAFMKYEYRQRDNDAFERKATSNAVSLGVTWAPNVQK